MVNTVSNGLNPRFTQDVGRLEKERLTAASIMKEFLAVSHLLETGSCLMTGERFIHHLQAEKKRLRHQTVQAWCGGSVVKAQELIAGS